MAGATTVVPAGRALSHFLSVLVTSTEQFAAMDWGGETVVPVGAGTDVAPPATEEGDAVLELDCVVDVVGLLVVVVVRAREVGGKDPLSDVAPQPATTNATAAMARNEARRCPTWSLVLCHRSRAAIPRTLPAGRHEKTAETRLGACQDIRKV